MSLEIQVNQLAEAIGDDIQQIFSDVGSLPALNTDAKGSLVEAINEVLTRTPTGVLLASGNLSDLGDASIARTNLDVRSTAQVTSEISAAIATITLGSLGGLTQAEVDARVQTIVDSAPAALDTLNEIAAAIGDDPDFAATIMTALSERVSYASPQSVTPAQQLQACQNIGVGNPEADFVAVYENARDN